MTFVKDRNAVGKVYGLRGTPEISIFINPLKTNMRLPETILERCSFKKAF